MKKIISLLLVIVLSFLMVSASSCNNPNNNNTPINEPADKLPSDDAISNNDADSAADRRNIPDDLPDMDFNGEEFRISFGSEDAISCIYVESEIGEVINDAVYAANRTVEERFNVNITPVVGSLNSVLTSIKAGDATIDLINGHNIELGSHSLTGAFMNLYNIPHLNFEKPWWPKNTVEAMTFPPNKMYIISNHIAYWSTALIRVMFMNKNKLADLGHPLPYDDVFNGTWTLDKFISITKDSYMDLNGNGVRDDDDFYGFVNSDGSFYCYLESWGVYTVMKDSEEILKLNMNTEKVITVLEKLYDLLFKSAGGYQTKNDYGIPVKMFEEGRVLFLFRELMNVIWNFKDINFDYGILPMPKLNEKDEYRSGYTEYPCVVPINISNPEKVGIIIEAMSAEGYKKVAPAFYEIALKVKYTHDDESVKILDIITESAVEDFWYLYGGGPGENMYWVLSDLLKNSNPSTDYASYYEKMAGKQQKRIEKIIDALNNMD